MTKKYFKRPLVYKAEQFDGTKEGYDRIRAFARSNDLYADDSVNVKVFRDDNFGRRSDKRVYLFSGYWLVVRDDGKFWSLDNDEFVARYGEA